MFDLPTSIIIKGQEYKIRNEADYRVIIDCFIALNDIELSASHRLIVALIIFYEDVNDIEDVKSVFGDDLEEAILQMYNFFDCNEPQVEKPTAKYNLIDWNADSMLISSAVNQVIGQEIRSIPYMHWWTFMGYYMSIKECVFSTVLSIRYKIAVNKSLDKHERKFRAENPQYFLVDVRTKEQRENDEFVRTLWNTE